MLLVYKLKKIKKRHRINVAISFAEQANIINVLTKGKVITILSVRTLLSKQIVDAPNAGILSRLVKYLYNKADIIVAPSKLSAQDLVDQFKISAQKLKVIYNYIDKEKVDELSKENIEDPFLRKLFEQPIMLNVGRLTPAKGQWLLLEMMVKIRIKHPEWKMVIIGGFETEGLFKSHFILLAKKLGLRLYDSSIRVEPSLEYEVYLLGFQANPFRFMRQSRMLLFPSVFEGFPNTLLEAMQSGLPIIVADCAAGPREILAPGSDLKQQITGMELTEFGILCPPLKSADMHTSVTANIIDAWMNAIAIFINKEDLKNKIIQNGYVRVTAFDRMALIDQWRHCIDKS